jgi:hypothetical protein
MLISAIKPGVYALSKDVANPEKDRRVKRDWTRAVTWKKGSRYIVRQDHGTNKGEVFYEVVEEGSRYAHHRVTEFMPGFLPLVEGLEPVEESLDTILTGQHEMAYNILDALVKEGKISLANIKETLDKIG